MSEQSEQGREDVWQVGLGEDGQPVTDAQRAAEVAAEFGWTLLGVEQADAGVWLVALGERDSAALRRHGYLEHQLGVLLGTAEYDG